MDKICLIGFMGCGKTTVGKALASRLGWAWTDLDAYIVQKAGKPISELFAQEGEAAFRNLEAKCLEEILSSNEKTVISTGGGVITTETNRKCLQQVQTVFLEYPFKVLYERIKGDDTRPLVTNYEDLHKRFLARLPLYEMSSCTKIPCEGLLVAEIVDKILSACSYKDKK